MAILTVFTPAYNRAHTLSRTYQSLQEQNCKDFVWLIVDDGSTDNTAEIVKNGRTKRVDLTFSMYIKRMEVCILRTIQHMKTFILS